MSMHIDDWKATLLQHALLLAGMRMAGVSSGDVKNAAVQAAESALLAHISTHPDVMAAVAAVAAAKA